MDPLKILESIIKSASVRYYIVAKATQRKNSVAHTNTLIDFPYSVSVKSIQKPWVVYRNLPFLHFMSILENAELCRVP